MELKEHKHQYINMIIRSILALYAIWTATLIAELGYCTYKTPTQCETQRAELGRAVTIIPTTLLAWLADSPVQMK
jgi:hypothetical protein